MKTPQQQPWMVSPKGFIKLLGAEYDILLQAGTGVLGKFYLAALSIVVIIFTSFGSIRYAIDLLFHDLPTEIFLSVFFALLFACIYVFVINTFSKEYSPGRKRYFSLSNIIRTSFIAFIAYLVAQPLAILAAGASLEEQTDKHKQQVLNDHLQAINSVYKPDLERLELRKRYCEAQSADFNTHHFDNEIAAIDVALMGINANVVNSEAQAKRKVNGSSFFLFRIQTATHYWSTWLLTIFLICLFLLPGYFIYSIASDNAYYVLKKQTEKNMILAAYHAFCLQYQQIFREQYAADVTVFSRFEDPPFRQLRKKAASPASMDAFLKKYIIASD